jgi:hypothetical protein
MTPPSHRGYYPNKLHSLLVWTGHPETQIEDIGFNIVRTLLTYV